MGVPAGRQLDGAAGREAGTDERVESGLTTFLTPNSCLSQIVISYTVMLNRKTLLRPVCAVSGVQWKQ
jgi:hypothetical protein